MGRRTQLILIGIYEKVFLHSLKHSIVFKASLKSMCGRDDFLMGLLSKQKGQILRVSAIYNMLFYYGFRRRNQM